MVVSPRARVRSRPRGGATVAARVMARGRHRGRGIVRVNAGSDKRCLEGTPLP